MCFLYFIPHFIKEMSLLYSVCVCYRRGTIEGSIFSRKNVLEHCLSGYKDYLQAYLSSIKLELYSKIFILDEFSVFCCLYRTCVSKMTRCEFTKKWFLTIIIIFYDCTDFLPRKS